MKKIAVFLLSCFLVNATWAKKDRVSESYEGPLFDQSMTFLETNVSELAKQIKSSESKRKPADADSVDKSKLGELNKMVAKVHALKTSEDVDALFQEMEANYKSYPPELQFYAATVLPMRSLRAVVYRLIPLMKSHSRFIHTQLLSKFKRSVSSTAVLFPYDHINAMVEYVSAPYYTSKNDVVGSFANEKAFQAYIAESVIKDLITAAARLEALKIQTPIVFDQKIIFGPNSFADGIGQYKLIGEFEKSVVLSDIYFAISSLSVSVSYNVDAAIDLYKEVGFLYGFDGFGGVVSMDGVTAREIAPKVREPRFAKLGTILPNGYGWLKFAHKSLKKSVDVLDTALNNVSDERRKSDTFFAGKLLADLDRKNPREGMKLIKTVINSETTESLRSSVSGDVAQINFKRLFFEPPKDLKSFLPKPNGFDMAKKVTRQIEQGPAKGKSLTYRNYKEGMPKDFDFEFYKTYFPSINSSEDVFKTARVLSHQGGNWLVLLK